jgi:hypothetical protein
MCQYPKDNFLRLLGSCTVLWLECGGQSHALGHMAAIKQGPLWLEKRSYPLTQGGYRSQGMLQTFVFQECHLSQLTDFSAFTSVVLCLEIPLLSSQPEILFVLSDSTHWFPSMRSLSRTFLCVPNASYRAWHESFCWMKVTKGVKIGCFRGRQSEKRTAGAENLTGI